MKTFTHLHSQRRTRMNRTAQALAIIATIVLSATSQLAVARAAELRPVALTGQPAPGTPDGIAYNSFGSYYDSLLGTFFRGPVLNDAGQTAFRADITGSGVDSANNRGIWSEGSGSLALVARTGSQAPGAGRRELPN